ncbi:MAG: YIP1 family protein, partial [Clostridia bacterium]|nr:YIP1 family protein [Clostridia bacterium]
LMVIGIKEVHQYSWLKTICTLFLTAVAALIILFICLLFFSLVQEIIGFFYSIQKEIIMRS